MERIFDFVSDIYYRVFGSTTLRPYESACLEAWKRDLSPDALVILDRQLGLYDLVQRHSAGKDVSFYCNLDPECKKWPGHAFFPLKAEESVAATMMLSAVRSGSVGRVRASIVLFRGRFAAIEFSKPPETVFPKDLKNDEIEVADVKLVVDPMSVGTYETEPLRDTSTLAGWLRHWAQEWELRDLRQPLPPSARDRILESLDTRFPSDYVEFIEQTEGLKIAHCDIHGLSQLRTIPLPDMTLYILAEVGDRGVVGVRQGDRDGVLHYLDSEGDEAEAVGTSLRAVIERELQLAEQGQGGSAGRGGD